MSPAPHGTFTVAQPTVAIQGRATARFPVHRI
jgi:hypothetical protein